MEPFALRSRGEGWISRDPAGLRGLSKTFQRGGGESAIGDHIRVGYVKFLLVRQVLHRLLYIYQIREYMLTPEMFGISRAVPAALTGGDPGENARIIRAILAGEPGPARDIALLNAGAAIYVGGRAATLAEGIRLAADSIDSGNAKGKLEALIQATRSAS